MKLAPLSALALLTFAGACFAQSTTDIKREGLGERRNELNAMELKAAPQSLWADLSDWSGGDAPTAASLKNKVVLLASWQCWNPASQEAMLKLKTVAGSHDDLVVVAIHDARKYDEAKKWVADNGLKVLLARDSGNKAHKTLKIDADPDFFLIDRAGNMRIADFETDAVEAATKFLIAETAEAAAAAPKAVKEAAENARREADKPKTVVDLNRGGVKPKVTFTPPEASMYEKAAWPRKAKAEDLGATDLQGQKLPNAETFGTKEIWVTEKPDWAGKVIVLDFWATWCRPCKMAIPMLEDTARKNRDDLVIIGMGGQSETLKVFEQYIKAKNTAYFQCFDETQTVAKAFGIQGIPHCVIISTDGTVRWQGNPLSFGFRQLVETTIEVDPGVAARRKAEAMALKKAAEAR